MRVDFYHLQKSTLEQIIPVLTEKAYASGKKVLIKTDLEEKAEYLNTLLWTYKPDSWLPHGTSADGFETEQPVLITTEESNPNKAEIVILVDGGTLEEIESFERCLNIFDGRDDAALSQARVFWKAVVDAGHTANYWQQSDAGKWELKVSKTKEKL